MQRASVIYRLLYFYVIDIKCTNFYMMYLIFQCFLSHPWSGRVLSDVFAVSSELTCNQKLWVWFQVHLATFWCSPEQGTSAQVAPILVLVCEYELHKSFLCTINLLCLLANLLHCVPTGPHLHWLISPPLIPNSFNIVNHLFSRLIYFNHFIVCLAVKGLFFFFRSL